MKAECPNCGRRTVESRQTVYGLKQVCARCKFVVKDVDKYAGVLLWGHKTGAELEVHANADSAAVISGSTRQGVRYGKVKAVHIPGELAGRRENNTRGAADLPTAVPYRTAAAQVILSEAVTEWLRRQPGLPEVSLQPCPGGRTVTQFPGSTLLALESILSTHCPRPLQAAIPACLEALRWREKDRPRLQYALALRCHWTPFYARGKMLQVLEKNGRIHIL